MLNKETFRRKPVEVVAIQFTEAIRDAALFDGQPLPEDVYLRATSLHPPTRRIWHATFYLQTNESDIEIFVDDWIITEKGGDKHVCKDEIFRHMYESVAETAE